MKKLKTLEADEEREKTIQFNETQDWKQTLGDVVRALEGLQNEIASDEKTAQEKQRSMFGLFAEAPVQKELRIFFQGHIKTTLDAVKDVLTQYGKKSAEEELGWQSSDWEECEAAISSIDFALFNNLFKDPVFKPKGKEQDQHAHMSLKDYQAFRVLQDIGTVLAMVKQSFSDIEPGPLVRSGPPRYGSASD